MSALAVNSAYAALLVKTPPRVIRSEEQNEAYLSVLYEMEQRESEWSADDAELADLLTLLIEDFEGKHYALPKSSSDDVLRMLMDQQGMTEAQLGELIGRVDYRLADILTAEDIRKLSEHFHVSPELFF